MYKLKITYDGTAYYGWQKCASGPSIQEELEKALFRIAQETVLPEAASRTDRGVHANEQVVQFALEKRFEPAVLQRALNAVLPSDIRVLEAELCNFHPTLDAIRKEYRYRVCLDPVQDPTERLYAWHFRFPVDRKKIERAIPDLLGVHDFSAFANEPEKDPICHLESIAFEEYFQIVGNRFLYKMVRNLVGTLLYIGCGKLPEGALPAILASKKRKEAGITAPAHGLYLHQVFYRVK